MAKKQKYYVIWAGHQTGIFDSWAETEKNIKGFAGAQYKSFESKSEAESASKKNYWASVSPASKTKTPRLNAAKFIIPSISVDAACAGNPGVLEYQGVNTETKEVLFARGPFPEGTVNLGEFLAIVHGLAYLKKLECPYPLYSDSKTAIAWVRNRAIKTNLERNARTEELFKMVDNAIAWLKSNHYSTKVLKWETEDWAKIRRIMAENRSTFEFKQFSLNHGNPGLKISTEACLFGAWTSLKAQGKCLDIGTGCGLLASMIAQAQPSSAVIALEIHPEVANVAADNFNNSPFKERLQVILADVSDYTPDVKFDFICSNPPFFTNHLAASDEAKHMAIHADHLSPAELAASIDRLLTKEGEFAVLYPADVLALFEQSLQANGFFIHEKVTIHSNPSSPILRVMACGSREKSPINHKRINIKNDLGEYSPAFIELLRPYYIIFPS